MGNLFNVGCKFAILRTALCFKDFQANFLVHNLNN